MPNRRFHLGIDYGTCASKLVFRDFEGPGGEKAYAVNGQNFRIPSAVGVTPSELIFGQTPAENDWLWFESLKMRMAGAVKNDYQSYFCGPPTPLPAEFSEKALATLTVWYLISQGHHAVTRYASTRTGEFSLGVTTGIPTSFLNDRTLTAALLDVARTAYQLYRDCGPLKTCT